MYCIYNYTLKGAVIQNKVQYEKETSVVFAQQIDISGARKFSVMDQGKFAIQYATLDMRSFYEVLPRSKKKKLYLDFDVQRSKTDLVGTGELVIDFLKYSSAIIQKIFKFETAIEDWLILNSSTPTKASYHALLNHVSLRFVDLNCMRNFILFLMKTYEEEVGTLDVIRGSGIKIVDLNVYHDNQNFRMFLSSKMGRANVLNIDPRDVHILKLSTESTDDITIQVILASLITQYTPNPTVIEDLEAFKPFLDIEDSSSFAKNVEPVAIASTMEQDSQLKEFVLKTFGAGIKYVNVKPKGLFVLLDPPLPCPYSGKIHSSNNVYLLVDIVKRSWTEFCHGSGCKNKVGVWTLIDPIFKFD